ncbi:MAG: T9SS type A sorting domain-containing protein, partial [Flavobacteriales bacterium]
AVTATDNCAGDVVISYEDSNASGTGCGVIQRTYTATDACGNTAFAEQTIIFGDQVAPEFTSFPADGDVSCDAVTPVEEVSIDFIDDCSNVNVSWNEELVPGDCANSYTLIRTCTLSDACGNETTASYVLNVADTEAPQIIGVSGDLILDCGEQIPSDNVVVIDNCSALPTITLTETEESFDCFTIVSRRWTATDDCGNVSQQVQIITFLDQTAPELSEYPESIVLDCGAAAPETPAITAVDNCGGDIEVQYSENIQVDGGCGTIERTWCAEDCTGNFTCHTQLISFQQASQMPQLSNAELRTWQEAMNRVAVQYTANESGRWGVDVYDLNGRLVTNLFAGEMNAGEMRSMVVDTDQFSSGMYIIQFGNGENKVTTRLPIVR